MQTKHYTWVALAVGLIVGIGGWLIFAPKSGMPGSTASSTQSTASTTEVDLGNGVSVDLPAGAKIEVINDQIEHPSLTRPITFGSSVSVDTQATLKTQEQADIAALTKDPTRVDLWLKLGNERKLAGDYQGAIDAWTYVAKAGSNQISYIAYGNLADLYTNWNKDYTKAAADLKAAIAIKPDVIDYYRHYVELYTVYHFGTKADAQAVLTKGLTANPGNKDLLNLQAQLNAQ